MMLKFMRKNARSWGMYFILGIIIIVFVLYFGSGRGSHSAEPIAVIDKKVISRADFSKEYENLQEMYKLRLGAKFNAETLKKINLKQLAYDNLLNKAIIGAKADDLNVKVSDEEIRNVILSVPAFQVDGRFDERQYQRMLRSNRMNPEEFEEMQRSQMNAGRIDELLREGIKISDQEIFDVYLMQNQKINLNFVQIAGASVKKKISPTEAELENYLKNNAGQFRVPEQAKIKYLYFSGAAYAPADISATDIQENYDRSKEKYQTKDGKPVPLEKVKGDIIKEIRISRGMQSAYAAAKKAHDHIYQEDNFDAYAAGNKLKIQAADFFALNKPPRELATIKDLAPAVMELQKNEMGKVLTSADGFYLVVLVDKKEAHTPKLQNILGEVTKQYVAAEINKIARDEANAMLERLKKGEKLENIAQEKGLKINETGFFSPAATIPKLGQLEKAADILYQLSAQKPYPESPIFLNNAYVILQLKETSKIETADFEKQKDLYKNIFLSIKKEEIIKAWLEGNKAALIKEKRLKIEKEVKDL